MSGLKLSELPLDAAQLADLLYIARLGAPNEKYAVTVDSLPVTALQQAALDVKQDELVSGTNIKTVNGTSLLGAGNIVISGGGATATTVEVDLGIKPVWQGRFVITDAAITAASKVQCWQAPGPYTGKGTRADEAEMSPVQVTMVVPGAGIATVSWQTPPIITMCRQFLSNRRDTAGATFDRLARCAAT